MFNSIRFVVYKYIRCDKINALFHLMNFPQIVITEESLFSNLNGKHRAWMVTILLLTEMLIAN